MRSEHHVQDIQVNNDKPTQVKRQTKTDKRETEERKKLLWERAEALKKKRANKLKEQLDEWKKNISTKMDEEKKGKKRRNKN